ncbi:hypothetical protein HMPREF9710_00079 [Massilia timonae CCUG 45783]|uniref:Uncharacterized protein n=1 Tax=Massilia timonae CCUG 45783 TaxID=883126 RepID=K9DIN1_9BURK|nr:hypothetical protein HMPREF9710_00079 [Massilia timonae CCUG 45783]
MIWSTWQCSSQAARPCVPSSRKRFSTTISFIRSTGPVCSMTWSSRAGHPCGSAADRTGSAKISTSREAATSRRKKCRQSKPVSKSIWAEDMDSWSRLRNPRKWLLCQTTRTFVSTNGRSVSRRLPSGVTFHASVSSWRSRTCTDAGRRQVFGLSQEYDRPGAWRHGGPPSRRAGCARPRFQDVADSASQLDAFAMRPLEPT